MVLGSEQVTSLSCTSVISTTPALPEEFITHISHPRRRGLVLR